MVDELDQMHSSSAEQLNIPRRRLYFLEEILDVSPS